MHRFALVTVRLQTLTEPRSRRLESSCIHNLQYIVINLKSVLMLLHQNNTFIKNIMKVYRLH
jgi:hypothetical protein